MSDLIEDLRQRARQGAAKLTIRREDVRTIASYFRDLSQEPMRLETVERGVLDGTMRFWGVPIEVDRD